MKKWLMKMFCPTAETLAAHAAEGVARSVNESQSATRAKVAKIAAYTAAATEIANRLSRMVEDGTIDEMETKDLKAMLTPVFDTALKYAFSW